MLNYRSPRLTFCMKGQPGWHYAPLSLDLGDTFSQKSRIFTVNLKYFFQCSGFSRSMGTVAHFNKRCQHCESRLPKWICACLHSRRYVVPHCNDVNVRAGRRHIILAKMSRMRRRVRTGFRCAATCRELTPPLQRLFAYPDPPDDAPTNPINKTMNNIVFAFVKT
jgi:hypothetical protein